MANTITDAKTMFHFASQIAQVAQPMQFKWARQLGQWLSIQKYKQCTRHSGWGHSHLRDFYDINSWTSRLNSPQQREALCILCRENVFSSIWFIMQIESVVLSMLILMLTHSCRPYLKRKIVLLQTVFASGFIILAYQFFWVGHLYECLIILVFHAFLF